MWSGREILVQLRAFWRRLRGDARTDADFAKEMESHLARHVEDNVRAGMMPQEARRQALIALGGRDQTRQAWRDQHNLPWLNHLGQDARIALRQIRRAPGFALTVVATLALGIGASTTVFTLARAFVFRQLPYPDANRIVGLWEQLQALGITHFPAPVGDYLDYRMAHKTFAELAAVESGSFVMSHGDYPERVFGVRVSANIFGIFVSFRWACVTDVGTTFPCAERPGYGAPRYARC
jgi:macrolide transport system ATP-binding/permease protein